MTRAAKRDVPWTHEQDDLLRKMGQAGENIANIAKRMDRSPGSVRIRALRLNVRLAKSGRLSTCPGWLALSEDRTSFVFLPDRASVVRRIFEMSASGLGGYTIAKELAAKNVPAFGPSPKWDQSTIHNMLCNRATIGEYQPKRFAGNHAVPRKRIPAGDIVKNYYPAVIDEALFKAAQEARHRNRTSGRGRKGRLVSNLFGKLPKCAYCDAPVKFYSNGSGKSLICTTVLADQGCNRVAWSYGDFEKSFFKLVLKLQQTDDLGEKSAVDELKTLIESISAENIYDVRLRISLLLKTLLSEIRMASAGFAPSGSTQKIRITRDHQERHFTIRLLTGSRYTGGPGAG
jgi:Recombinase